MTSKQSLPPNGVAENHQKRVGVQLFKLRLAFYPKKHIAMNRVKLVLTAIGVFAVIGGAMAYKVSRGATSYCALTPGMCTTTLANRAFSATATGTIYCTNVVDDVCTIRGITFVRQ